MRRADVLAPIGALAVMVVLAGGYLGKFKNWVQFRTGNPSQAPTIAPEGATGHTVDTSSVGGAPIQIITGNMKAGQ